jgi:DNA-binding helix-hairpin-helix protein with protein kinase domain
LAKLIAAVHQENHAFGELHPDKFLVDQTHVYGTECVDLHIQGSEENYEGKSPLSDYAPPNDSPSELSEYQKVDLFALAIIIFQILMKGFHPFEAQGSATTDGTYSKMISDNEFPYRDPQTGTLEPPEEAPPYDELPETLQEKFNQIFIEGKLNPDIRPPAVDWVEVIDSLVENSK